MCVQQRDKTIKKLEHYQKKKKTLANLGEVSLSACAVTDQS